MVKKIAQYSILICAVIPLYSLAIYLIPQYLPPYPTVIAYLLLFGALLLPVVTLIDRFCWSSLLLSILLPLEALCAFSTYHTVGELARGGFLFLMWLNVIPLVFFLLRGKTTRKIGFATAILIACLLVPWQGYLVYRWKGIEREAKGIIQYAENNFSNTRKYPYDLASYPFERSWTSQFITYESARIDHFLLKYYVGSKGTSHIFSPGYGWSYYPD
ncbi:hypothetical protein ACFLU6_09635 [Acidobacteriota bacterium]